MAMGGCSRRQITTRFDFCHRADRDAQRKAVLLRELVQQEGLAFSRPSLWQWHQRFNDVRHGGLGVNFCAKPMVRQ